MQRAELVLRQQVPGDRFKVTPRSPRRRCFVKIPDALSDLLLFELAMLIKKGRVTVRIEPTVFLDGLARRFVVVPPDAAIHDTGLVPVVW